MFKFFKKEKIESLGEYSYQDTSKNSDKIDITKVVEELRSVTAANSSQTQFLIVDSNKMNLILIKIVMSLDTTLSLKEAKQVVDTSGTFTTKLNNEQALRLIESCKACGIILQIF